MATKYYKVTGELRWFKGHEHQYDAEYEKFSVDVLPDENGKKVIAESGVMVKPRKYKDTGETYYQFRRPKEKMILDKPVHFGPIPVYTTVEDAKKDENRYEGSVGNGSKGTVMIAVYDGAKGKGHRVEGVLVNDLVVYQNPNAGENGEYTKPW